MITWLLQTNLINYDQMCKIANSLKELNIKYTECELIPFINEFKYPITINDDIVIPYGSTGLIKICQKLNHKGLYFNEDNLRSDIWFKNRNDMLNQDALIMSMSEAITYMSNSKVSEPYFVRPINDLKEFFSGLISKEEFIQWSTTWEIDFDDTREIVIAPSKNIQAEWRWFVVNGAIIDGSMYRYNGNMRKLHETDKDVIKEAQKKADIWLPDDVVCMDLALVDNELKVVEFNCFNATGFYSHDIKKILHKVTEYTTNKF